MITVSRRINILSTILNIGTVAAFFTIYAVVQNIIYNSYFTISEFTLDNLMNACSRESYIVAPFNSIKEEILYRSLKREEPYSTLYINIDSTFSHYFNKAKENEKEISINELTLDIYYSELYSTITRCNSIEICSILYKNDPTFSLYGCENDMNKVMKEGVVGIINLILINLHNFFFSYITEKNLDNTEVYLSYLDNSKFNDLSNFYRVLVDLKNAYLAPSLEFLLDKIKKEASKFLNSNITIQEVLLSIYLIATALIFFVLFQFAIVSLNTNIWKAKRLLSLYPLQKIAKDKTAFKKTLAKLR